MDTLKNKAVVLGTDNYIGLAIIRNLGRKGIYITTMDYQASIYGISRYAKEAKIVPHYSREEDALVQYMVDYAREQEKKPVLFLSSLDYVNFLTQHFQLLKNYYLFPMEDPSLLNKLKDKRQTLEIAKEYNIPTPETINLDEDAVIERCTDEIGYPCLIKPKDSLSFFEKYGKSFFRVFSEEELVDTLESLEKEDVFIQRIIPGPESNSYSIGCYYGPSSHLMGFVTTETIRQWPNNFGDASYLKQKWVPQLVPLVYRLFEGIKYRGFAEVELKRDEFTGVMYLININTCFMKCTALLTSLGFETPFMYYLDSIGQEIPKKFINYNTNRHWKSKYNDISAILGYLNSNQMNLFQILTDNKIRHVSSSWAWDDPGPGMSLLSHVIKETFGQVVRKITRRKDDSI